jgi:hypothetical protein
VRGDLCTVGQYAQGARMAQRRRAAGGPRHVELAYRHVMDPIRDEPRFQAIMRELQFPN